MKKLRYVVKFVNKGHCDVNYYQIWDTKKNKKTDNVQRGQQQAEYRAWVLNFPNKEYPYTDW
jgi:hypothetical protein